MIPPVNRLKGSAKRLSPTSATSGRDNQAPAIGGERQRSIGGDFEKLEHTTVDYKSETVPMLGQTLDHTEPAFLHSL